MGNNSTKESREGAGPRSSSSRQTAPSAGAEDTSSPAAERQPHSSSGRSRSSRHGHQAAATGDPATEPRKETRAEREARKAEKERIVRAKERERSLKEESIDGGYLVTLGVYTGAEDFSKPGVRQLMLERRIAPFWRGLDDHSDAWVEHQLIAAARGLPIPAPDEIPLEYTQSNTQTQQAAPSTQPIAFRHGSVAEPTSKPSSSFFSRSNTASPASAPTTGASMFRGMTLSSLASKNSSQQDLTPQEIQLPHDPNVNGQPVEAFLYKDASECPICFLYYPPYLNKTRCCDQPICSECFVQIKRPDPHPPEHADPSVPPPTEEEKAETEGEYVSEPATCPFCKQLEFGVTYEPPPFKRGLAYASHHRAQPFVKHSSAMSSAMSLSPPAESAANANRRRATSLSANAPQVISTDKIRPDWAKKLADARAHQARRAAAATALHNAAYVLGAGEGSSSRFGLGRRRRQNLILTESSNGSGSGTPQGEGTPIPNMELLLAALENQREAHRAEGRTRSRGNEIEELMLMEAIRQSIATEEDRRKKEDKAAAKELKRTEKEKAKEQKKLDKAFKRNPSSFSVTSSSPPQPASPDDGKGKARAVDNHTAQLSAAGFVPLTEPSSTLNTEAASGSRHDAQRHLEQSRANLGPAAVHSYTQTTLPMHQRTASGASSPASSFADSPAGSSINEQSFTNSPNLSGQDVSTGIGQHNSGGLASEPMFNLQELQAGAVMGDNGPVVGSRSSNMDEMTSEVGSSKGVPSRTFELSGGVTAGGRQEGENSQKMSEALWGRMPDDQTSH